MSTIHYRSFEASDAEGVFATAKEAWHFTYANIFDTAFIDSFVQANYAPERLVRLVPQIEAGQMFFQVALDSSTVIGFCHIGITQPGAELFRLYLRPAYIGRGIGHTLLQNGETFLRSRGYSSYSCFVHKDNERGKQFYLRHGFQHRSEYDHDDEWYMEKRLG